MARSSRLIVTITSMLLLLGIGIGGFMLYQQKTGKGFTLPNPFAQNTSSTLPPVDGITLAKPSSLSKDAISAGAAVTVTLTDNDKKTTQELLSIDHIQMVSDRRGLYRNVGIEGVAVPEQQWFGETVSLSGASMRWMHDDERRGLAVSQALIDYFDLYLGEQIDLPSLSGGVMYMFDPIAALVQDIGIDVDEQSLLEVIKSTQSLGMVSMLLSNTNGGEYLHHLITSKKTPQSLKDAIRGTYTLNPRAYWDEHNVYPQIRKDLLKKGFLSTLGFSVNEDGMIISPTELCDPNKGDKQCILEDKIDKESGFGIKTRVIDNPHAEEITRTVGQLSDSQKEKNGPGLIRHIIMQDGDVTLTVTSISSNTKQAEFIKGSLVGDDLIIEANITPEEFKHLLAGMDIDISEIETSTLPTVNGIFHQNIDKQTSYLSGMFDIPKNVYSLSGSLKSTYIFNINSTADTTSGSASVSVSEGTIATSLHYQSPRQRNRSFDSTIDIFHGQGSGDQSSGNGKRIVPDPTDPNTTLARISLSYEDGNGTFGIYTDSGNAVCNKKLDEKTHTLDCVVRSTGEDSDEYTGTLTRNSDAVTLDVMDDLRLLNRSAQTQLLTLQYPVPLVGLFKLTFSTTGLPTFGIYAGNFGGITIVTKKQPRGGYEILAETDDLARYDGSLSITTTPRDAQVYRFDNPTISPLPYIPLIGINMEDQYSDHESMFLGTFLVLGVFLSWTHGMIHANQAIHDITIGTNPNSSYNKIANDIKRKNDIDTLQKNLEVFYLNRASYPTGTPYELTNIDTALIPLMKPMKFHNYGNNAALSGITEIGNGIITELPTDPDKLYRYTSLNKNDTAYKSYILVAEMDNQEYCNSSLTIDSINTALRTHKQKNIDEIFNLDTKELITPSNTTITSEGLCTYIAFTNNRFNP